MLNRSANKRQPSECWITVIKLPVLNWQYIDENIDTNPEKTIGDETMTFLLFTQSECLYNSA